jgi:hypothetical protein
VPVYDLDWIIMKCSTSPVCHASGHVQPEIWIARKPAIEGFRIQVLFRGEIHTGREQREDARIPVWRAASMKHIVEWAIVFKPAITAWG